RSAPRSWAWKHGTCWKASKATRTSAPSATTPAAGARAGSRGARPERRLQRRNAQLLPGVDLVRVAEHGLVGLEVLRILVGVAVVLLGNGRERVAAHHVVVLRLGLGRGDGHEVVDLLDAGHVAAAQRDFLQRLLRRRLAAHVDRAGGAV